MQKQGYVPDDTLAALNYLLTKELVEADHMNFVHVDPDDLVRIQASGFIHVRVLCERFEYLYGVLPTTPIRDPTAANLVGDFINRENVRGDLGAYEKVRAIEIFFRYLVAERDRLKRDGAFIDERETGASYVLDRTDSTLYHYRHRSARIEAANVLDLI
jgi:hypothetical protein